MSHSSSYFLERNTTTSYAGPLTQTRIGVSSVAVPSMGPMRGQYVFLISKCVYSFYIQLQFIMTALYFTEIIVLISWEGTPTQIRMRVGSITFHACWGAGGGGHDGSVCLFMSKF